MVSASLWDVRNQFLCYSTEAEGSANETRPAFFIEDSRAVKAAKTNALSVLSQDPSNRIKRLGMP
ncbi:MAG: hypothetical protein ACU837_06895 [Gammaproteobacteria bacterium]